MHCFLFQSGPEQYRPHKITLYHSLTRAALIPSGLQSLCRVTELSLSEENNIIRRKNNSWKKVLRTLFLSSAFCVSFFFANMTAFPSWLCKVQRSASFSFSFLSFDLSPSSTWKVILHLAHKEKIQVWWVGYWYKKSSLDNLYESIFFNESFFPQA